MGNSRGPPDAREWHFRALGALASHSPRHGRPRLERPLLDAIGADPRASKPAELSTAAPKPGALIAPPPAQARPTFGPGRPRGAQPGPPQLALHGPLLVAFGVQLHKTKPTELPVGAPMPGSLESTVPESRQHEPGPLSVPGRSRGAQPVPPQLALHGPLIVTIKPSRIKESPPSCLLLHRSMPRFDRRAKDHEHEPEAHARPLGRSRGAQHTPRTSRCTGRCSSSSAPIPAIQVPPSCTLLCRSEPRCDHRVRGSQKRAGPTFRSPRRSRAAQPTPRSPELPGPCSLPSAPTRGRYSS